MDIEERARAYLEKMEPTQCGSQSCHARTFRAACVLVAGFALQPSVARRLLCEWASKGTHPWSDKEIDHKINQAEKAAQDDPQSVGSLRGADTQRTVGASARVSRPSQTDQAGKAGKAPPKRKKPKFDPRDTPWVGGETEERRGIPPDVPVEIPAEYVSGPEKEEKTPESDPISEIYGGKKALWRRILAVEREEIRKKSAEKGEPCRMPDTLHLDRRVCPHLPETIDGLFVTPSKEAASVKVTWENCLP